MKKIKYKMLKENLIYLKLITELAMEYGGDVSKNIPSILREFDKIIESINEKI